MVHFLFLLPSPFLTHLLNFSLLSSLPFFPFFFQFPFPFSGRYIYIISFPLPVIFPFVHFSPFPFFVLHPFSFIFPCPPLFFISLSPSFSPPITFLPSFSSPSPLHVFPIPLTSHSLLFPLQNLKRPLSLPCHFPSQYNLYSPSYLPLSS